MMWSFWYLDRRLWIHRRRVCAGQRRRRRSQRAKVEDDMWGPMSVTQHSNEFSVFQIYMNSAGICYFCKKIIRAPNILKIFV